jgi:hypothetical protein
VHTSGYIYYAIRLGRNTIITFLTRDCAYHSVDQWPAFSFKSELDFMLANYVSERSCYLNALSKLKGSHANLPILLKPCVFVDSRYPSCRQVGVIHHCVRKEWVMNGSFGNGTKWLERELPRCTISTRGAAFLG